MDHERNDEHLRNLRNIQTDYRFDKYSPFREYYQIRREHESSRANNGKELGGHTEPSHSLFGFIGQIATETGWSIDYILNEVNYVQLSLMMADLPHFVKKGARSPQEIEALLNQNKNQQETQQPQKKGLDPVSFFNNLKK